MLLDDGIALRGLFLIDKQGVVRHQVVNDLPLGRSVDEALRMVQHSSMLRRTVKSVRRTGRREAEPSIPMSRRARSSSGAEYSG